MSSGRLKCKSLTISQEESLIRSPRVPKRLPLSNLKTKECLVSSTRLYFHHRNWYICLSKRWSHHLFLAVGSRGILKKLSRNKTCSWCTLYIIQVKEGNRECQYGFSGGILSTMSEMGDKGSWKEWSRCSQYL